MAKIGFGKTEPGADWQEYSGTYTPRKNHTSGAAAQDVPIRGIYVDVETSFFNFNTTPKYAVSLSGTTYKWATTGGDAVYNPTNQGFRVYVRRSDGADLTPELAKDSGLHIHWLALEGNDVRFECERNTSPGP